MSQPLIKAISEGEFLFNDYMRCNAELRKARTQVEYWEKRVAQCQEQIDAHAESLK